MPVTWCSGRQRHSRLNNSRNSTTSMSSAPSVSIARPCRSCASRERDCWSGYRAAARQAAPPLYLAPYFAAKAAMDAMAVVYARELTRWGIETSIIVPGAFTGGTNHFAHSGSPVDVARVAEYEAGPYKGFVAQSRNAFTALVPPGANASSVADAIVRVVDSPFGKRPFRGHI